MNKYVYKYVYIHVMYYIYDYLNCKHRNTHTQNHVLSICIGPGSLCFTNTPDQTQPLVIHLLHAGQLDSKSAVTSAPQKSRQKWFKKTDT